MPNAVPPQLMGVPTNALLPGVQANSLAAAGADQAAPMVGPMFPFNAMPHMHAHMFMQLQQMQQLQQQQQQMQQAAQPQGQQNQQKSQQGSGEHRQRQTRRNTDQQQDPQKLQFYANQESSFERPSEKAAPLPARRPTKALEIVDPKTNSVINPAKETGTSPSKDSPNRGTTPSKAIPIIDPKTNAPINEQGGVTMEAGQPTVNSPYSTARTVPIGEVANGSEAYTMPTL
jgi:hypothetical protein